MSETVATEAAKMRKFQQCTPEHSFYRSAVAKCDGRWTAAIDNKSESVIVNHINSFHLKVTMNILSEKFDVIFMDQGFIV